MATTTTRLGIVDILTDAGIDVGDTTAEGLRTKVRAILMQFHLDAVNANDGPNLPRVLLPMIVFDRATYMPQDPELHPMRDVTVRLRDRHDARPWYIAAAIMMSTGATIRLQPHERCTTCAAGRGAFGFSGNECARILINGTPIMGGACLSCLALAGQAGWNQCSSRLTTQTGSSAANPINFSDADDADDDEVQFLGDVDVLILNN